MPMPEYEPTEVVEAARELRSELPKWLPADKAAAFDQQLAEYLAQADAGEDVAEQIMALFQSDSEARELMEECLSEEPVSMGYKRAAGNQGTQPLQTYECPSCRAEGKSYTKDLRPGESAKCPEHKVKLVLASGSR